MPPETAVVVEDCPVELMPSLEARISAAAQAHVSSGVDKLLRTLSPQEVLVNGELNREVAKDIRSFQCFGGTGYVFTYMPQTIRIRSQLHPNADARIYFLTHTGKILPPWGATSIETSGTLHVDSVEYMKFTDNGKHFLMDSQGNSCPHLPAEGVEKIIGVKLMKGQEYIVYESDSRVWYRSLKGNRVLSGEL